MDEQRIEAIVSEVLRQLRQPGPEPPPERTLGPIAPRGVPGDVPGTTVLLNPSAAVETRLAEPTGAPASVNAGGRRGPAEATEPWPRSGGGAPLHLAEFPQSLERAAREASGLASGVFETVDQAVRAAEEAFEALNDLSLEKRGEIIAAIRATALANKTDFAERTMRETGMGRVSHKERKFEIVATKTPGIEFLRPSCFTGDRGLTVDELAPFGVIGAVTPSTHPLPTMVNNAICFIAAGNAAVFNAHPASMRVFAHGVEVFNRAIQRAGGPPNLITCVAEPSVETAKAMFVHPGVRLVLVTGGPAVVREALRAPKRAICAGPGNPPVVVDETADIHKAAESIILGGAFDNNILCIGEKQVFVVEAVAEKLMAELETQGCMKLGAQQIEALTRAAFSLDRGDRPLLNRNLIGRDAAVLARAVGIETGYDPPLLFGETGFDHLFVQEEQMMPFIPIVRCRNVTEAINLAIASEHGYGHTACIHSRNIQNMHEMARRVNTTLFVKNGPSTAALGAGGEGYTSFSIAGATGEGCTTPLTFTRQRRCALVDYFRIV